MFEIFKREASISNSALIEAIERTAAVIEFTPDGTVLRANEKFLTAMGYGLNELIGQHHSIFVPDDQVQTPEYKAFWAKLAAGEFVSGEFERLAKNGDPVWIQGSYAPVYGVGQTVTKVVKVAHDITENKTASRNMEHLFDAIELSQACIEFDPTGVILSANENFLATVDYAREEIIGQHHKMFVSKTEHEAPEYEEFWQKLRAGHPQQGEFCRYDKSGDQIWLQATYTPVLDRAGAVTKVVKFANDVTAQRKLSSRAQSQIAAIQNSQAVIEFEPDGTIIEANENFLKTMGYSLQEIVGQHHRMFMPEGESSTESYQDFWQRLAKGETFSGRFHRISKSGDAVWVQASYAPLLDTTGAVVRVMKIAADVTAQALRDQRAQDIGESTAQKIGEIAGSVALANDKTTDAARASQDTLSTVQSVASAAEQFGAASREISSSVITTRDAAQRANEETLAADRSTNELTKATEAMNGIVSMIQDIAEQINLLALNATIEAARAGDAGRGFSVVASEVKNLASQVANAIGQITGEISNVQSVSGDVVGSLQSIRKEVAHVNDSVSVVAAAIEEQSVTSQEVTANMQTAAMAVGEINSNLGEISDVVHTITENAEDVRSLAEGLRKGA